MRQHRFKHVLLVGLAAMLAALGIAETALAGPITPGFDYLYTPPGGAFLDLTTLGAVPPVVQLVGDPIGPGNTDTIIERTTGLADGETGEIQAEIVALSLKSIAPVNALGADWNVSVSLSPAAPSTGSLQIFEHGPDGGLFDSSFDVHALAEFTEVGVPSNVQVFPFDDVVESFGSLWSHTPPPGYPAPNESFFPGVAPDTGGLLVVGLEHSGPHPETFPAFPEPGSLTLLGFGAVTLLGYLWRRKRDI